MEGIHFGRWEIADRSPSTLGVGPLRPTPAHPIHSLRDGLVFRLRGGIGPLRGGRWGNARTQVLGLRTDARPNGAERIHPGAKPREI